MTSLDNLIGAAIGITRSPVPEQEGEAFRLYQMHRMLARIDEATARRTREVAATTVTLRVALERVPFHTVYQAFLARRISTDNETTFAETERDWRAESERDWRAKAKSANTKRIRSGVLLTNVGALVVAFSTAAIATNFAVPTQISSDNDRSAFDAVLLSLSGSLLVRGVARLIRPSPVESSSPYNIMRETVAAPRASFQLAPTRQGSSVGLTIRFRVATSGGSWRLSTRRMIPNLRKT